jgi:ABC-type Fe3+-hydroxamate transport system substrate-binding protein
MQPRINRLLFAAVVAAVSVASVCAQATPPKVIASTSWTAAVARAAGAKDIVVIAPMELQHPPEYEIKPSDVGAVSGARLLVYAGYEKFAARLREAAGSSKVAELQINTDNLPPILKAEARKIAEKLGTVKEYESWAAGFDSFVSALRSRVRAAYPATRVATHRFLKTYAEWLGFEVVGVFGPGEPSPAVVLDLVRAKPDLVIDNWHNPSGKPIAESLKKPLVTLINFPGKDGTRTIEDVFRHNERAILGATAGAAAGN